jgi:organic radical activating enzyme
MKNIFKTLFTFDPFQWWLKLCVNPQGGNFGGKAGRFTRGAAVTLSLSTKCNLSCQYCPNVDFRKTYPRWDECSMEEWQEYIEKFPEFISLVLISGGEPTLIKWVPKFTNWLISTGRKVVIFTNLAIPEKFKDIKPSSRLQVQSTFHHKDDKYRFTDAYEKVLSYGHKVDAVEVGNEPKVLSFTHQKPFITPETASSGYFPDGTVYARQFHAPPDAPKTRAVYCGAEWTYPDKVIWREND